MHVATWESHTGSRKNTDVSLMSHTYIQSVCVCVCWRNKQLLVCVSRCTAAGHCDQVSACGLRSVYKTFYNWIITNSYMHIYVTGKHTRSSEGENVFPGRQSRVRLIDMSCDWCLIKLIQRGDEKKDWRFNVFEDQQIEQGRRSVC